MIEEKKLTSNFLNALITLIQNYVRDSGKVKVCETICFSVVKIIKMELSHLLAATLSSGSGNVNKPSSQTGFTPLMMAAKLGDREMVRKLLQAGALKSMFSPKGHTAAHFAKKNGHLELSD